MEVIWARRGKLYKGDGYVPSTHKVGTLDLIKQTPRAPSLYQTISNRIFIIHTYFEILKINMKTSYVNVILALAASVSAAPTLQARTYPTVATYEVTLGEVDPAYLAQLETAVVNLDEGAATKRDNEARQTGTCDLQG